MLLSYGNISRKTTPKTTATLPCVHSAVVRPSFIMCLTCSNAIRILCLNFSSPQEHA